jgi:hypothetical protein
LSFDIVGDPGTEAVLVEEMATASGAHCDTVELLVCGCGGECSSKDAGLSCDTEAKIFLRLLIVLLDKVQSANSALLASGRAIERFKNMAYETGVTCSGPKVHLVGGHEGRVDFEDQLS